MKLKFLSEEWFDRVAEITRKAGNMEIPIILHDMALNITIIDPNLGEKQMCLNSGKIEKGHRANAPTHMVLPTELALSIFIKNDTTESMHGFMSGKIKVEGDLSKLMIIQSAMPSTDQLNLQKDILEFTEI